MMNRWQEVRARIARITVRTAQHPRDGTWHFIMAGCIPSEPYQSRGAAEEAGRDFTAHYIVDRQARGGDVTSPTGGE